MTEISVAFDPPSVPEFKWTLRAFYQRALMLPVILPALLFVVVKCVPYDWIDQWPKWLENCVLGYAVSLFGAPVYAILAIILVHHVERTSPRKIRVLAMVSPFIFLSIFVAAYGAIVLIDGYDDTQGSWTDLLPAAGYILGCAYANVITVELLRVAGTRKGWIEPLPAAQAGTAT